MARVPVLAAWVQHNMPQNKPGSLTPQQAYDIAAYIDSHPRPQFNPAYKKY
jgi:thiosulfate dehydrogenase